MTEVPIIRTVNVKKIYRMGTHEVHALRGITLDIKAGEYVSIMGPSGSGKSTFFNMVGVLDMPSEGEVFMRGHPVSKLSPSQLAWVRCHNIGYIFQSFNLIPTMTALQNVSIARIFAGSSPAPARDEAAKVLDQVGLGNRIHHVPAQLSGGQQQRVAIARALVNQPAIILADEPTGNLDLRTGEEIINLLSKMKSTMGITIITATHDMKMLSASDTVVRIKDGAVESVQSRDEIQISVGTIDGKTLA